MRHFLFVLVGPSLSGKSTLTKRAMERLPLKRIISCTTRAPREGEVDGVHYRFLSVETFKDRLTRGHFAEYDQPYSKEGKPGNFYGRLHADLALVGQHHCICDMTEIGVSALQETGRYDKTRYIRLEPFNRPPGEREAGRAAGDEARAKILIRIDHVIRNNHGDPNGVAVAADDLCSYIEQHIHPEG